ncbi:ImmA/IrrE family metallo-endopeptidase [Methyloceanibacter marginalis]|uniref:ImmA/IrrE family metallo-endopeptidase n=1 Tax=Methyloceanibacter marginalis TaxID=1774971 RepID=UPI001301445D|nr:ImmA/IrrE family metallo-endopeptidase [Methyloceanibacter marginalis]
MKTAGFGLREARQIYRAEAITIDRRPLPSCLKAIYMCDEVDVSVAIRIGLPMEPTLFALVHELKHHWADQELVRAGYVTCGDYNQNELVEKGAEVFAAEFIYPVAEFSDDIKSLGDGKWDVDKIIRFKREVCRAKVSYTFVRKRLERLGLVSRDQFDGVKFQKREEEIYGTPLYKQRWFRDRRRARTS